MEQIFVIAPFSEEEKQKLCAAAPLCRVSFPSPEELESRIGEADMIVGNPPPALLRRAGRLRLLQLESSGANQYAAPARPPAVEGTKLHHYPAHFRRTAFRHYPPTHFLYLSGKCADLRARRHPNQSGGSLHRLSALPPITGTQENVSFCIRKQPVFLKAAHVYRRPVLFYHDNAFLFSKVFTRFTQRS